MNTDDLIPYERAAALIGIEPKRLLGYLIRNKVGDPIGGETPDGRVFSLRSTDDGLDVSAIAKQYGGGGHRNASGFRVDYDTARTFERAASTASSGVQYKPCEICTTQSWCETHGCQCYPVSAVQPERCCLDYPRCDCNSPPEPDDDWLCFQRHPQPKVTP